jgi:MFS family permease
MAEAGKGRVRFSGVVLILCGLVLLGIGDYLLLVALDWPIPEFLPAELQRVPRGPAQPLAAAWDSMLGLVSLYLLVFGGLALLAALWMVVFGRRNWLLVAPLLVMFAIFVAFAVWAALDTAGMQQVLEG